MKASASNPSLSRDFVLLSLVIVVFLGAVSVWVAYRTYEDHSQNVISHLESESLRIDRALIVEIENSSYLLESLARQISQIGSGNHNGIARLLRSFNDQAHRDDVFSWIDSNQQVVVSSNRGILGKPIDVSDRDYIKKALTEPWKIQIGRPIQGRVSERWVLPICLGLTDYRGNHVGAILSSIDIVGLTDELRKVIREAGIDFSIYSTTLNPLTETNDKNIFTPRETIEESLKKIDFSKQATGALTRASLFKPDELFTFFEVSTEYPYVIVVSHDPALSETAVRTSLRGKLAQVFSVALLLVTILWIIRAKIIKPVLNLCDIVADIARGKRYRPLEQHGPVEIEMLAQQVKKIDEYLEERRRKENELLMKNRYLSRIKETSQRMARARLEFLRSLSLELGQPLQTIEESVQALKDQHFGPLPNRRYIDQASLIYQKTVALHQMVNDLAAISETEYGTLVLHEQPMDISFAIHRAIRHFTDQPVNKHSDIKLRLDDQLPKLMMDEEKLNQILLHTLANATARSAPGSSIIIETMIDKNQEGGEEFVVMLKFNLRQGDQVEGPRNGTAEGLHGIPTRSDGISLALTRMLLSLHNGRIESSVSHNQVCRIFLRFPDTLFVRDERKHS
jgi:signal transduction histidine kinase